MKTTTVADIVKMTCPLLALAISSVIVLQYLCLPVQLKPQNPTTAVNTTGVNLQLIKHAIKEIREKNSLLISSLRSLEPGIPAKTNPSSKLAAKKVVNGVFWSDAVEMQVPKGFTTDEDFEWISTFNCLAVVEVNDGCGRMQNRLLLLADGQKVCARYRKNNDQIHGEFFSFLLARILSIGNVPPSTISMVVADHQPKKKWKKVKHKLKEAQWEAGKPIVLTKHIEHLMPAFIPSTFRTHTRQPLSPPLLGGDIPLNTSRLVELVQWSDLIVFDYLTANTDRILNNIVNQRWNPQMMASAAHNLLTTDAGLLVFLDNESGLFHGYRLLAKYEPIHRSLLEKLCIFRKSTIDNLRKLDSLSGQSVVELFARHFRQYVPSYRTLNYPMHILPKNTVTILKRRIRQVLEQVNTCQRQYD